MKLELTEDELKKILLSLQQSLILLRDEHSKVSFISAMGIGLAIDELEQLKKLLASYWDYENDLKEEIKEKIEINIDESPQENTKPKKQKNFKILNIFVVIIISFVAFIIIVDTFKYPIGKIVPNVEFILYNLYESIKDISLFIRDLI